MLKKFFVVLIVVALLLVVPVNAATPRVPRVIPLIEFNGTEATCTVIISADNTTDRISATMELKQGTTPIDDWSATATKRLEMEKTATVQRNKTYTLTINYSINGVAKTPVSISRTNS